MKFSIITASRNSVATIRDTMESVASQRTSMEIEYLVIDGGSTDGTVEVIRDFAKNFNDPSCTSSSSFHFRWISESDRGMYDALNKGIRMASGDVIGIVNADDVFGSDDIISQIAALWEKAEANKGSLDAIYGDIRFVSRDLHSVASLRSAPTRRYCSGRFFRPWQMRFGVQVAHPSFFCRREVFLRLGLYLTDFGMYADFELLVRYFLKAHIRTAYIPLCTTVMRMGGASTGGLRVTGRITKSDRAALRSNGIWTCTPLLLLRLPVKSLGWMSTLLMS